MGKGDLQTTPGEAVGVEEILAELDQYFDKGDCVLPSDITVRMLMQRYELGEGAAKRRMEQIAAGDGWLMRKVSGSNGGMWVLRKV